MSMEYLYRVHLGILVTVKKGEARIVMMEANMMTSGKK